MADFNDQERGHIRAYDSSHIEIVLRVRQLFEKEKQEHRRINLNNVIERTVIATGVSKNMRCRVRTMEDVKGWKKKSGDRVLVGHRPQFPNNFSSVVRHVIREMYLERTSVPTPDSILDRLRQKKVSDLERSNLFDNNSSIPAPESDIWVWGRTSLYKFMKKIGFIHGEKISHYEYTRQREDV